MASVKIYIAVFKAKGTNPSPDMVEGWLSLTVQASSKEQAQRWVLAKMEELAPWLKYKMELCRLEPYRIKRKLAGPCRGLVLSV